MAPKAIVCPNCGGPVPPNTTSASLACAYCKHHFENPLYEKPVPQQAPPAQSSGAEKSVLWIYLISTIGGPILIIGIVFGIYRYTSSKVIEYSESIQKKIETQTKAQIPNLPSPAPVPVVEEELSPDVQLDKKLNIYVDCATDSLPNVKWAMDRYLSWVKTPSKAPNCKERYIDYGIHEMSEYALNDCTKITDAASMTPAIPELQAAAAAHLKAFEAIVPIINEASTYYKQKQYTLDNCSKAQTLHPRLMQSYATLESTYHTFYKLLESHARGSLTRCLARTGQNPTLKGAHDWAAFMIFAQQLFNTFNEEAKKKSPNEQRMKQIAAKLMEKSQALQSMTAEQKDAAGYGSSAASTTNNFIQSVMAFIDSKAGTKLDSSARFFVSHGHAREMYAGTSEHLRKNFNSLLSQYNADIIPCAQLLLCTESECPER